MSFAAGHGFALLVMAIAAGFLVYTYAGYPLLMSWLQRKRWRYGPARADTVAGAEDAHAALPPLTILISAFNAQAHIQRKLASMLALDYPADKLSVLVVSDGSVDATNDLVEAVSRQDDRVRLLAFAERRGKAACLNDAVAATSTELLLLTDARQTFKPDAARRLVRHFADPAVGAVSGALEIDPAAPGGDGVVASAGAYWRMEKKLRAAESQVHSAVGVTGAIYALRRAAFEPIPAQTILDDVLIPMVAVMNGWRVLFDREAVAFDLASISEAQERQRKIRTLAGNFQLVALRPALVSPARNPLWWQFFSHKLFRVLAPVAMAAFLLANVALAGAGLFWLWLLLAQLLVYTVTVLPEGQGALWQTKPMRLLKTLRGFVRLQWFAVLGFVWFWRNRQPQLWETTRHAGATRETR